MSKDYNGIALADEHQTDEGHLEHKEELTWRDAASKATTPPPWIKQSMQDSFQTYNIASVNVPLH